MMRIDPYRFGAQCLSVDPYFANVVLLLRGQGTDGGTTITDDSDPDLPLIGGFNPPDTVSDVTTETDQSLTCFGASSLFFPTGAIQPGLRYASADALAYLGNSIIAGGPGQNAWTMEAWVYPLTSDVMAILSYRPPVTIGWAFTTQGFRANIGSTWSDTWISEPSPPVNQWTHVAMVRDGSDWYYFHNGVLLDFFSNSGDIQTNIAEVAVGHGSTNTTEQQFRGHMYLRYTVGVARYTADFTPPNNFPAA